MNESQTPRTDCKSISIGHLHGQECFWVDADFARRLERENLALHKGRHEVEQILGKALDYPNLYEGVVDGQLAIVGHDYPGAKKLDELCIGEHVTETLATEAATKIAELQARVKELEQELLRCSDVLLIAQERDSLRQQLHVQHIEFSEKIKQLEQANAALSEAAGKETSK